MNRMIITRTEYEGRPFILSAVLNEQRKFETLELFPEDGISLVNRIYAGRVDRILKGINAAFVRFSSDQSGYLPLSDAAEPVYTRKASSKDVLCVGDEILVQVVKDAVKTKEPVLTTHLTISGALCLLMYKDHGISVSKKIAKNKASDLKVITAETVNACRPDSSAPEFGLLLRTNAGEAAEEELSADITSLITRFDRLMLTAEHASLYTCLYEDAPGYISLLKSIRPAQIDMILTDCEDIADSIRAFFPNSELTSLVSLYKDASYSMALLYSLDKQLGELTKKQVWLPSGANIIIEQLETLTFIDVNTAKNISTDPVQILKVNLEAAEEIARQLRLRNISGMILVDFINMKTEEDRSSVSGHLKHLFLSDPVKCDFIDFTKLGLAEITRKKVHKSLKEIL